MWRVAGEDAGWRGRRLERMQAGEDAGWGPGQDGLWLPLWSTWESLRQWDDKDPILGFHKRKTL